MKRRHFLGKPIPQHQPPRIKHRVKPGVPNLMLVLLPFMALFGFLHAYVEYQPQTPPPNLERSLNSVTRAYAADLPAITIPVKKAGDGKVIGKDIVCNFQAIFIDANGNLNRGSVFPFIPKELSANTGTNTLKSSIDGSELNDNPCGSAFWDRKVIYYFVVKILAILNWLAGAVAIMLTVYAGILYMTGFAREDNVKKAKTILLGAFIGLSIVFLARILIYGAVNLFTTESSNKALENSVENLPEVKDVK